MNCFTQTCSTCHTTIALAHENWKGKAAGYNFSSVDKILNQIYELYLEMLF